MNRLYLVKACLFWAAASVGPAIPVAAQSGAFVPVTQAMQANPDPVSYAVNGKQYVMTYTGGGQSATTGPLGLTGKVMPPAVAGHNAIYVFALP